MRVAATLHFEVDTDDPAEAVGWVGEYLYHQQTSDMEDQPETRLVDYDDVAVI